MIPKLILTPHYLSFIFLKLPTLILQNSNSISNKSSTCIVVPTNTACFLPLYGKKNHSKANSTTSQNLNPFCI